MKKTDKMKAIFQSLHILIFRETSEQTLSEYNTVFLGPILCCVLQHNEISTDFLDSPCQ